MLKIVKIVNYTIPYLGNRRSAPYAKLLVDGPSGAKIVETKELDCWPFTDYIVYARKRYSVRNVGSLYSPHYVFE